MTNNNITTFISDFRTSGIINWMQSKYDVVMVWLSGSSALGITDEESDYDLGVLVADNITFSKSVKSPFLYNYKKENKKQVQCIYNSFEDIFAEPNSEQLAIYRYLGWAQFRIIEKEHIIYINPKYSQLVEQLIANRLEISLNAINSFLQYVKFGVDIVHEPFQVGVVKWGKMLSHLCWCADILSNTSHDKERLLRIKRALPQDLNREDRKYAFNKIKFVQQYLENPHKVDLNLSFLTQINERDERS